MKKITTKSISILTTNLWKFRVLVAALKLDIFDVIAKTHSASTAAAKLKLHKESLGRLLDALVALEFLTKKGNRYFNTPVAAKFLTRNSADYYGNFVLMASIPNDAWENLDEVIRSGKPMMDKNRVRMTNERFTAAMHNNAQAPAREVSKMIAFKNKKHLLDIGGGSGAFSIILTNKYNNLKATVLEQPQVCKVVKKYVREEGQPEKIKVLSGNYFKTPFPIHDVALFGQVMHSNTAAQNIKLLQKVYSKLETGGLVLITEFVLNKDRTGPIFPALFDINMLKQTPGGKAYTFSDIKSWLKEVGFKDIKKQTLVGPHTLIMGKK